MYECTDDVFTDHRPNDKAARTFRAQLALTLIRETLRDADEEEKTQFRRDVNRFFLSEAVTDEEKITGVYETEEGNKME